jgi:glycosyltransferase involved in cell wall biosynthesis
VRIRGLRHIVRGVQSRRRLILAFSNYRHARALGAFDVVEAPDWQAEGLLFALRSRSLVTHLHTPHSVLLEFAREELDRDSRFADWLERLTVRRSAAITCPSELLVTHLRKAGWLTNHRVEIIRYPVDVSRFRAATPVESTTPSVLVVGRLERRKAPERVIAALSTLRAEGVSAEAVFVGFSNGMRDGIPYVDWLERLATELNVTCRFVGEIAWEELPTFYDASRVVCVPSDFESFSMAAVEGMAAARPVVVSDSVGASELLAPATHGQICSMEPEHLAVALKPFFVDGPFASKVGESNRRILESTCDPALIARAREVVYHSIATHR